MKFKQMPKSSYHFKTKLHIVIIELSLATKRRRFSGTGQISWLIRDKIQYEPPCTFEGNTMGAYLIYL